MTPTRKRRLIAVSLVLAAAAVAGVLIALALQSNVTYLHTPSDVASGTAPNAIFRLGGVVTESSMQRTEGTLEVRFSVTDRVHTVPVRYSGILPDLFREGQSIIARGEMLEGEFQAEEILAKHDETYMPKEVQEAMDKAKREGKSAPHAAMPPQDRG